MFCNKERDEHDIYVSDYIERRQTALNIFLTKWSACIKLPALINILGNQFRNKNDLYVFRWIYEMLSSSNNFACRFNRFLIEMVLFAIMETAVVRLDQIRFGEANARRRNITTFQRGRLSRSLRIGVQLEIDPSSTILL